MGRLRVYHQPDSPPRVCAAADATLQPTSLHRYGARVDPYEGVAGGRGAGGGGDLMVTLGLTWEFKMEAKNLLPPDAQISN